MRIITPGNVDPTMVVIKHIKNYIRASSPIYRGMSAIYRISRPFVCMLLVNKDINSCVADNMEFLDDLAGLVRSLSFEPIDSVQSIKEPPHVFFSNLVASSTLRLLGSIFNDYSNNHLLFS